MSCKGQKSQEVIDYESQGILLPFLSHCQLESCHCWRWFTSSSGSTVFFLYLHPNLLNCTQTKWRENGSGGGRKLRLTIHGVVAFRELAVEAAANGEAMWLGHRAGSAGETLFTGKVALWRDSTTNVNRIIENNSGWAEENNPFINWIAFLEAWTLNLFTLSRPWDDNWTWKLSLLCPIYCHVDDSDHVHCTLLETNGYATVNEHSKRPLKQKGHVLSMKYESILASTLMWQRESNWIVRCILPSLPFLAEYPQCCGASWKLIWFPSMSEGVHVESYNKLLLCLL